MEKELSLQEIMENISENRLNSTEEFFVKKFGKEKGINLIKFLSSAEAEYDEYKIKFAKYRKETEEQAVLKNIIKIEEYYNVKLLIKDAVVGQMNFSIFTLDPKFVRMVFSASYSNDNLKTLDLLLKIIDEIAMKIDAKLVDGPYPSKGEQAIYRQHKYEPFTDHPSEKSDYVYNKYDIRHCKTDILGLFDYGNENS